MYNADSAEDDATHRVKNIRSDCRILYNAGIGIPFTRVSMVGG